MILAAAILAVLATTALAVLRALLGPTVFDRVLAANSVGTSAILLLALYGYIADRPVFLDIGILYALLNIIATLAVLKFFRHGDLGFAGEEEESQPQ
jgi:multicomponent Na+:H+ antiporter subunit F